MKNKPDVFRAVYNSQYDRMDFYGIYLKYVAEEGRWVEDKTKERVFLGWFTPYRDKKAMQYFVNERIVPGMNRPERAVYW